MSDVVIWTDGGCHNNGPKKGIGGWAVRLKFEHAYNTLELSGAEAGTTNNRMELQAVIEALGFLPDPCEVELWTDSEYVRLGITQWIRKWRRNGWRNGTGADVKNRDLWERLYELARYHAITWRWVRGHDGNPDNERCDALCSKRMRELANKIAEERVGLRIGA